VPYELYLGLLTPPAAIVAFLVGYAFGSIPFGLLVTRLAGTGDIRTLGSGNIGATNVLRTGRKGLAAATLIGDMLKGAAAVLVMDRLDGTDAALVAGLGAVIGHVFPVWLRFKGGKGVATYIGALIAIAWPIAAAFAAIWAAVAALTRYSSLAGLVAAAFVPPLLLYYVSGKSALLFLVLTVLVFIMHRANIARLLAGTERKIGGIGTD
jgi:acyl phosphate:glycerol-3-phosphate acyltransferase